MQRLQMGILFASKAVKIGLLYRCFLKIKIGSGILSPLPKYGFVYPERPDRRRGLLLLDGGYGGLFRCAAAAGGTDARDIVRLIIPPFG